MSDLIRISPPIAAFAESGSSPLTFNHTAVGEFTEINRMAIVSISIISSTIASGTTVTWGGISMTLRTANSDTTGAGARSQIIFDMDETAYPADGVHEVEVIVTGGGSISSIACVITQYANVQQIADGPPTTQFMNSIPGTTITQTLDSPANALVYMARTADAAGFWIHNLSQVEIVDVLIDSNSASHCAVATIFPAAIATSFTSTFTSAENLIGTQLVYLEERLPTEFQATVAAVSTVTSAFGFLRFFESTVVAVSAVAPDLQRDRGFQSTVAVQSAVTTSLARSVTFGATAGATSDVVVGQFLRAVDFTADVVALADAPANFNALRPFASTVVVVSTVDAQFGSDFDENKSSLTPGGYVELFEIDTTVIGGSEIFRFITQSYDVDNVFWQGNEYLRFPIEIEGFEWNATAQAPPRPTMRLSNVNKFVLAAVIGLGDLLGSKVTRWRTYSQYLDGQPQANPNGHFPPDIFIIQQKIAHSKVLLEWTLSSVLDVPGDLIPGRQVLRDETPNDAYAPGVSQTRFRGR